MQEKLYYLFLILTLSVSCQNRPLSYGEIKERIEERTDCIELLNHDRQSRMLLSAEMQGRVLTSTNTGGDGRSLGWISPNAFDHDGLNGNAFHGEERVWIGPLGSQHSFYYGQIKPLSEDNWDVPASFSDEPFTLVSHDDTSAVFYKKIALTNHVGTHFSMELERKVCLLKAIELSQQHNINYVGYEITQRLTNTDTVQWRRETGLATLWDMNSFKGSDSSFAIIPINASRKIPVYTYLSELDQSRLVETSNAVWFRTDGKYRSKIGLSPQCTKGLLSSYEPEEHTLRIIEFRQSPDDSLYSNSHVYAQEKPYMGESIPIYNHGPMDLSLGEDNAFYELESSAAMQELMPYESIYHYHKVHQFTGAFDDLNLIAFSLLGVDLNDNPFFGSFAD